MIKKTRIEFNLFISNTDKMEVIPYEITYLGNNFNEWKIKNYIISENRGKWFCTCSIKYKRDPSLVCKHIDICKFMLKNEKNM